MTMQSILFYSIYLLKTLRLFDMPSSLQTYRLLLQSFLPDLIKNILIGSKLYWFQLDQEEAIMLHLFYSPYTMFQDWFWDFTVDF